MAISTNPKPTIYRNLYENTGPNYYMKIQHKVWCGNHINYRASQADVSPFQIHHNRTTVQSDKAVTHYFTSKQLLPYASPPVTPSFSFPAGGRFAICGRRPRSTDAQSRGQESRSPSAGLCDQPTDL